MTARYAHTNLIASDWQRLARFYQDVFGCEPVPPERDLSGHWLDKATGIGDAHIKGVHLRLPGYGDSGPTLEIFQYDDMPKRPSICPNTPGFTHIAFAVEDVAAIAQSILQHGGSIIGDLTVLEIPGAGVLTFQYLADPEGNILEVQRMESMAP
ncbi:MAG: VOC family protein [Candidatus Atribacteria bacterium]|nr:MAG: VOC family protein [Candidatus Atribacteria bacterium]